MYCVCEPLSSPLLCGLSEFLGPSAQLCAHEDLKPVWSTVPRRRQVENSLVSCQRGRGAAWPRSSKVKAKLRSYSKSSPCALAALSPPSLGYSSGEGKVRTRQPPKRAPALLECGFPPQLGRDGLESSVQDDSECSVDSCTFFCHQPHGQSLVLSLGPFFPAP